MSDKNINERIKFINEKIDLIKEKDKLNNDKNNSYFIEIDKQLNGLYIILASLTEILLSKKIFTEDEFTKQSEKVSEGMRKAIEENNKKNENQNRIITPPQ